MRRLWDRVTGRGQAAPTGADTAYAPGPAESALPSPMTGPAGRGLPSASEAAARQEVARLQQRIDRLPPEARTVFEDAVLHLVRTDGTLRAAFEQAPDGIPTVAKYAVDAHLRESLRESQRESQREQREAQHESPRETPPAPERPQRDPVTAEEAMNAARDTIMAADARQFAALRDRWERPARSRDPVPGGPDARSLEVAEEFERNRREASATRSSTPRRGGEFVDGQNFRAVADPSRPPPAPALLNQEGHALLRDQVATSRPATSRGSDTAASPSRRTSPAPGRPGQGAGQQRRAR
ncbi:hypothetical protein [Streptomyces sp. NPDC003635]